MTLSIEDIPSRGYRFLIATHTANAYDVLSYYRTPLVRTELYISRRHIHIREITLYLGGRNVYWQVLL